MSRILKSQGIVPRGQIFFILVLLGNEKFRWKMPLILLRLVVLSSLLVQTEISQQQLNGLLWNFVQKFMALSLGSIDKCFVHPSIVSSTLALSRWITLKATCSTYLPNLQLSFFFFSYLKKWTMLFIEKMVIISMAFCYQKTSTKFEHGFKQFKTMTNAAVFVVSTSFPSHNSPVSHKILTGDLLVTGLIE